MLSGPAGADGGNTHPVVSVSFKVACFAGEGCYREGWPGGDASCHSDAASSQRLCSFLRPAASGDQRQLDRSHNNFAVKDKNIS